MLNPIGKKPKLITKRAKRELLKDRFVPKKKPESKEESKKEGDSLPVAELRPPLV